MIKIAKPQTIVVIFHLYISFVYTVYIDDALEYMSSQG